MSRGQKRHPANLHASKGDVDNVGQLGLVSRRLRVAQEKDIVQLGEGVDGNGYVGALEVFRVLLMSVADFSTVSQLRRFLPSR